MKLTDTNTDASKNRVSSLPADNAMNSTQLFLECFFSLISNGNFISSNSFLVTMLLIFPEGHCVAWSKQQVCDVGCLVFDMECW